MGFELSFLSDNALVMKQAADDILKMNELSENYGLSLTVQQVYALLETRSDSLRKNGRIEFGGGVIDKLIEEFCDSVYINDSNYEETLNSLLEIFYYYKNETLDKVSDEELISYMKSAYENICRGSFDLLVREMDKLVHLVKYGEEDLTDSQDPLYEEDIYE